MKIKKTVLMFVLGVLASHGLFAANGATPTPSKLKVATRYGLQIAACCCDGCAVPFGLCTLCMSCIAQKPGACELCAATFLGASTCFECIACSTGSVPCGQACVPGVCCFLCLLDYANEDSKRLSSCANRAVTCAKSSSQWCQKCAKMLRVMAQPHVQTMDDSRDKKKE